MKFWFLGQIMGVWGPQPPEAIGSLGAEPPFLAIFLIKIPQFEAYLSLNFWRSACEEKAGKLTCL